MKITKQYWTGTPTFHENSRNTYKCKSRSSINIHHRNGGFERFGMLDTFDLSIISTNKIEFTNSYFIH